MAANGSPDKDYALIGDTHTAALVGRDGSMDWLCVPRFDSGACFAKLLGDEDNGFWRIGPSRRAMAGSAPAGPDGSPLATRRRYRGDSLVLEMEFDTPQGSVRLVDLMPVREQHPEVVRVVEGLSGTVEMEMELVIRFGYGSIVPWVRTVDGVLVAIAGPDAVALWSPVHTSGRQMRTLATFTVREGQQVPFHLSSFASYESLPRPVDARYAVEDTCSWWHDWCSACQVGESCREEVLRSLITLKALTYAPTGGIVAAVTTSLPETVGGVRNWDYRYCWLRDAALALDTLMAAGHHEEAMAWRKWLLRAVAGDPAKLQIMYGVAGERSLPELELSWLGGYEKSLPVRVGNAASRQLQLDVYGEVMCALHEARRLGLHRPQEAWDLELVLLGYLETGWRAPDEGIWEVRGPRRDFTYSKVMAWAAITAAIDDVERYGLPGPLDRWKALRDEIHAEVCEKGYDHERNTFTQYYGSKALDASLLLIPRVGLLPPTDKRVLGTIAAIEEDLVVDGFVRRYDTDSAGDVDGLTGREGAFLACSFWLVDDLALVGRTEEAHALYEKLLSVRNDVGLLSEEYDPQTGRLLGNFPQAFSHLALVNSALCLSMTDKPDPLPPDHPAQVSSFHRRRHHGVSASPQIW